MRKSTAIKFDNVRFLRDGKLIHGEVWVENGKFIDPQERFWRCKHSYEYGAAQVIDGKNAILSPGFIDIQVNGAFGIDFSDINTTSEDITYVCRRFAEHGVTSFCPTIVSSHGKDYMKLVKNYKVTEGSKAFGASMLGMHLEGPFINVERKGAHEPATLASPSNGIDSIISRYTSLDNVAIITMAPELDGALEAIPKLVKQGIVVSAGHSMATVDVAQKAVGAGVTLLTHLFNAMAPFHHRDPGLIGLLGITENRPFYSIILDGIHCHKTSVRIAFAAHPDGLVLVTDAMAGLGLSAGRHCLAGMQVDVTTDKAVLAQSQTLAGSIITMDRCVRNLRAYTNCTVAQALEAATLHPAQVLGIENKKGTLNFGADADFILLDDELRVLKTYIGGELVYESK